MAMLLKVEDGVELVYTADPAVTFDLKTPPGETPQHRWVPRTEATVGPGAYIVTGCSLPPREFVKASIAVEQQPELAALAYFDASALCVRDVAGPGVDPSWSLADKLRRLEHSSRVALGAWAVVASAEPANPTEAG